MATFAELFVLRSECHFINKQCYWMYVHVTDLQNNSVKQVVQYIALELFCIHSSLCRAVCRTITSIYVFSCSAWMDTNLY